ncbi:MAG: preprotein translocase subunit SecE [Mycoplasmataceae bacterium]|jgi:preprotein translocase SecE subunit|nr:preprotein translocase subunit SecE [Mycoplasmataceae bacterium]
MAKKEKKNKTSKDKFSFKIKKWFFGLGKEFSRVKWTPKKTILVNFIVIFVVITILALIFLGLDFIFLKQL